ncbi:LamG-like jellyroll fold domain-containing protein [Seonamhaeicola sp.]|uniref:LamG-like jellyroll fold domain-containing protein n=1 Tax=Seonamhaeicola sp. TaxID=1912245 RepID=UPI0026207DC8|nr:LamG-like jellyroll fold domain-containing protein [Seonamhaeicola sp.]
MKKLINLSYLAALWLCLVVSFSVQSQTVIDSEDFESNSWSGILWNDGGDDCQITSTSWFSGSYSVRLEEDEGGEYTYTDNIDLSGYNSVTITFDFRTSGFDSGDDLIIEFSDNGGSNWDSTDVLHYSENTDFNDGTTYTNIIATATNGSPYSFSTTSRFRFRANASSNEYLYIDNIVITGYFDDADGDGIADSVDLDDDNDGIRDDYECSAAISFSNASVLTASNLNDVKANEKVLYSNALLFQNQYYDIVLTVLTISGSFTLNCDGQLDVSSFNSSNDDHVTYSFDLVESGSATPGNPAGTPATLYDIILELRDIDTSSGDDFTEIVGFNPSTVTSTVTPSLSPTTNLEQAGFVNSGGPSGYTLYRLDPTIAGSTTTWSDEPDDGGTHGDDPDFYLYMEFDRFSHVDLVFGATGTDTSTGVRWAFFGVNSKCDFDDDGFLDTVDIDSDNDGIPDNVEAQPTIGYIPPSNVSASITDANNNGLDDVYESAMGGTDLFNLEDTDGDGLKDYLDSDTDNDGKPDIEENNHANTLNNADSDNDGLDDIMDSVTAHLDVNDEVTTGDVADLTNSFGDVDSDATIGGDLDYRDLFDINPPVYATIDFDGVDDYLSRTSFIDGMGTITLMAWVKTDTGNTTDITIAGEDTGCKLWLQNGNRPTFTITSAGNAAVTIGGCSCSTINYDEWHHITAVYTSSTGAMTLYVDGEQVATGNVGSTGKVIENTDDANGNFEVGRRSTEDVANLEYFKGDIDEVRVFDVALTAEQIQMMVYQEIQDNSGNVRGAIIPKDIGDSPSCSTIPWSNLIAYYPMTNIKMGKTSDYSSNDNWLYINYITTIQDQTAPMPYKTGANGSWTTQATWEHGDVWDIESIADNKDWCIVKIEDDVTTSNSHTTQGLIIDASKTLTVNGDHLIQNSWYFELNGTLDLMEDSQLIQTEASDLVTSADGKLLRRQEGTTNPYWYNYWSSPIGATGVTTLTDNNAATNNANNTPFSLNMLKDGSGFDISFTSAYTASGNIGTYWLYTFINGITYYDWAQISTTADLSPGVGYTQKGTGNAGLEQQYIFQGKPNNGTILVSVTDVGGAGSVADVSKTDYLLGNPYPSALDIHKFIDDNVGVIDGTLQLWQQWSGSSHYLDEYNGGYAQVNKTGATRAYQFVGMSGANNGSQDGTSVPSRYLPIGQGFITEIIANGNVEFNNGQRVFILEDDADGTYNNGSVFFKNTKSKSKAESATAKTTTEEENPFKKIRLEFNTVTGPDTRRELLLGFSNDTSDDYDYGYDSECDEVNNNDLNLNLEGQNMNIQAYGELTPEKVVPLNFKSSGNNSFEIKITDLENIEETEEIYLRDNLTGAYFDLKPGNPYGFSSEQGKFNDRFEIVFQSQQQSLSVEEENHDSNFVYYLNQERKIYVKKLNASVKRMALINMTGQTVMELQDVPDDVLSNGIAISNVSTGGYIACFRTDDNQVLTKKIIVN